MDALVLGTAVALVQGCRCSQLRRGWIGRVPLLIALADHGTTLSKPVFFSAVWFPTAVSDCQFGVFQTQKMTRLADFLPTKQPDRSCTDCPQEGEGSAKV